MSIQEKLPLGVRIGGGLLYLAAAAILINQFGEGGLLWEIKTPGPEDATLYAGVLATIAAIGGVGGALMVHGNTPRRILR